MEKYEEEFKEFYNNLNSIKQRIDAYKVDPLNRPHKLPLGLLQEMELLHMKLDETLYRLRLGELEEQLQGKEITFKEYCKLTKELSDSRNPYRHI